jgi:hypothetical protein
MSDASDAQRLRIIECGPADRRLAERLAGAGFAAELATPDELLRAAQGTLYLLGADRAASLDLAAAIAAGAHLCLVPPWPVGIIALPGTAIAVVPAPHRDAVRLMSPLAAAVASQEPLRILYREQLAGAHGQPLVASASGEPLFVALPRTSNRQGHLLATTLMLGTASAQTDPASVAALLRALTDWLTAVPVDRAPLAANSAQDAVALAAEGEQHARIALLALALAAPALRTVSSSDAKMAAAPEEMLTAFAHVTGALGLAADDTALAAGWAWLREHGVVQGDLAGIDGVSQVIVARAQEYIARWQLAARIRRLSGPHVGVS